jgi:hypothetical protein
MTWHAATTRRPSPRRRRDLCVATCRPTLVCRQRRPRPLTAQAHALLAAPRARARPAPAVRCRLLPRRRPPPRPPRRPRPTRTPPSPARHCPLSDTHLHKHLDEVQDAELDLRVVNREHKVERRVVAVDELRVLAERGEAARGQKGRRLGASVIEVSGRVVSGVSGSAAARGGRRRPRGAHADQAATATARWAAARAPRRARVLAPGGAAGAPPSLVRRSPAALHEVAHRVGALGQEREDLAHQVLLRVLRLRRGGAGGGRRARQRCTSRARVRLRSRVAALDAPCARST